MGQDLYFYGWVGGWVGGEMEIKANLSQSLVEVEAELGKTPRSILRLKRINIGHHRGKRQKLSKCMKFLLPPPDIHTLTSRQEKTFLFNLVFLNW